MDKLRVQNSIIVFLVIFVWTNIALADSDAIHHILVKGIKANFSGDYDQAAEIFSTIQDVNPNHPSQAFYQAVVLFWRNNVDAGNPRYEKQIRQHLQLAKEQAEQMLAAKDNDVDALHYLGLVYTYLGRIEAHNGNLYNGGVLGERGRKFLERAINICQQQEVFRSQSDSSNCRTCEDLYFPYGAYSYFAGRLPQFLKVFDFLWFIPSGSTEEGLQSLERAYRNSELHQLGAQCLLVEIFLHFETEQINTAKKLSDALINSFPDNPYLELQHANILIASGDTQSAAIKAQTMLEKVDRRIRNYDVVVKQGALLVKAEAAIRQGNTAFARKILVQLEKGSAYQSNSLTPHTDLLLGMLADIEMQREKATSYYERAKSYKGPLRNRLVDRKANQYLQKPFSKKMEANSAPGS